MLSDEERGRIERLEAEVLDGLNERRRLQSLVVVLLEDVKSLNAQMDVLQRERGGDHE